MRAVTLRCARIGCPNWAVARVGVDPIALLLVLDDHIEQPGATAILCERHLARLTAPRGWWIDDRRTTTPALFRTADEETATPLAVPAPDIPAEVVAVPKDPQQEPAKAKRTTQARTSAKPRKSATATVVDAVADQTIAGPASAAKPAPQPMFEPGSDSASDSASDVSTGAEPIAGDLDDLADDLF